MTDFEIAERNKDHQSVEDFYGSQTFTWQGNNYACLAETLDAETLGLELGGLDDGKMVTLSVRLSQFASGAIPVSQQTIIYKNESFRIEKASQDHVGIVIELFCVSDTRGI